MTNRLNPADANQVARGQTFVQLHQAATAFVLPNPWDAGSARLLHGLGFAALATTSAGFANTLGRLDGQISLAEKVDHCRDICAATPLPVSADLENGFDHSPVGVAQCLREVASVGVVGGSIEDFSGDEAEPIYPASLAVERIQAAAAMVASFEFPFVLTARCENFLHGKPDLDDTIARLVSYADAGADVLYAPGLTSLEQIREVAQAVAKPINVLVPFFAQANVQQLSDAGATRLSLGSALFNATLAPLLQASTEMLEQGSFGWVGGMASPRKIAGLLSS